MIEQNERIPVGFDKPTTHNISVRHTQRCHPFYVSRRWIKLRAIILARNPVCQLCDRTLANTVDHVDNNRLNNSLCNLWSLCQSCHSWKTNNIDYGLPGSLKDSVNSIADYQRMMVELRLAEYIDYTQCDLSECRIQFIKQVYQRDNVDQLSQH